MIATVPQDTDRRVKELSLLFEISRILDRSVNLKEVLDPILELIARQMDMQRAMLTLLDRRSGEVFIEAAFGLSEPERERGRYKLGEGVTGEVVASGRAAVVPIVALDPRFLNRTGALQTGSGDGHVSFVCVPVKLGGEVIGALSADRRFAGESTTLDDARLLSIVASMIAEAVGLRQIAAAEQQRLIDENTRLQQALRERFRPSNMIGTARSMQDVYDLVAQVAGSGTTVLLRGESGTGKELVANAIHYNSRRADKPFIRVNCAALTETIIESELFGHEKGAFTGATLQRKGRFELANGGTLFLDEVGDLSASTQIKLLRVLQEREFERVGGATPIKTDVRVIAATNRDLEALIESGQFRQDLYYRLNVFPIHLPPLRKRVTDIPTLADYFVEKYNQQHQKNIRRISTPAIDMLVAYHWPGNVRELENCIERAVLLSNDDVIHGHHLPPTIQTAEASGTAFTGTLQATLDAVERELLMDALKSSRGNMALAARALGITERIMGLRVKKFAVAPKRFRTKT
ncbi:MAG: sigma 54-interacting transcriptional regulator [Candidatus Schekmanbacteria bacterium]|nr:sigma 54-interacting transcriptional regulator [Candidatus Schekmanbacteria bacterium]